LKRFACLLLLLLLIPVAPAVAADTDLLLSKITYALAGLVDAIASESESTPDHAERLATARTIDANLAQQARRYWTRVAKAYPASQDVCVTDTLTGERNCMNSVTQATIDGQVIALFGNSVKLQALANAMNAEPEQRAKVGSPPVLARRP
jgi:hypothetical protein